ncbi:MAG: beta-glucosidase BglX [Ignavibacteriales bacterium]|nr:beta-glucosidase BglX [Ignavibacteriales bacterium]
MINKFNYGERKLKKIFSIVIILISTTIVFSQTYKNPKANIEDRINDLLNRMTLDEKIEQMQQNTFGNVTDEVLEDVKKGNAGSFLNTGGIEEKTKLQKAALESRLGIPLIFGRDVIHGFKTMLPIPLGQAASWNPELVEKGAKMAAREAAEDFVHWTFAPMLDISRDPRWGRIAESCGEDPYLTSKIGIAMVNGFQGKDISDPNSIAACAKHYVGYGAAEGGKDYNTTLIPEGELRNIYLKPFQEVVNNGIATVMSAFNDLNGVPTSGNSFTLKKVLRDEWKFDGFVVSDWGSIDELIPHGYAKDGYEAALKAASAGVNMEMVSKNYVTNLKDIVESGKISEIWIDELVKGILRIKFKMGLFEQPFRKHTKDLTTLSEQNKEIAKQITLESIVLLQNEDNFLPLDKSKIKKLAIVGPLADAPWDQLGCWTVDGKPENTITPLTAIKNEYGNSIEINYCKGLETTRSNSNELFNKSIETVNKSDAAILFLGEDQLLSGETHSRAFITLPGIQEQLIKELAKTGKPLVLVIMAGRSLTFGDLTGDVKSILYAWHPGTMGGPALADIIFGKVSPSGKLPVTMPRTVGQIPLYYNHKNTGRPPAPNQLGRVLGTPENPEGYASYYLDVDFTPAYYFGYGLSYAEFEYSDLKLSSDKIGMNDKLEISVNIKNTGDVEAKETVQLYIHDLFGSITRPVKELKGFEKISLKPGEIKNVKFTITAEDLKFYDINMNYTAEAGDFDLFVGSSANNNDLLKAKFTLN